MWLGLPIKHGVPAVIGSLHHTRSPTNTHLTYYLGTKLSRYLDRGISTGHLDTSSHVMMVLCPCSPRQVAMPSMRPLILYRLHSSKQLIEGTCLFYFDSSITYFISHHERCVNVSCWDDSGKDWVGFFAATSWFLHVTISALG
jgi:hypothetical protein